MPVKQNQNNCGIGIRGVAMTIDTFVWLALMFVAFFGIGILTGDLETVGGTTSANLEGTVGLIALGLWLGLGIAYHTLLEWRFGKTIGKALVNIRVTGADGSPLTLQSSLVRNVSRLVDWLPLFYMVGIALLATSDQNKRLGDRWGDTAVVPA